MSNIPQFEFCGPPCKDDSCSGVLFPALQRNLVWRQCTKCHHHWDIRTRAEAFTEALAVIDRVLQGNPTWD